MKRAGRSKTYWSCVLLPALAASWFAIPHRNPATVASDRLNLQWWKERHELLVAKSNGHAQVAFLGDSITQFWEREGKETWDKKIAPLGAANLGFSGDSSEHVLWHIENGELTGLKPKVVVLLVGTNNLTRGATPKEAAEGVKSVVNALASKLPESKILVLGLLPREGSADDEKRVEVEETNALFKDLANNKTVFFKDLSKAFVWPDGTLRSALFWDYLHPTEEGYEVFARALVPELKKLLAD